MKFEVNWFTLSANSKYMHMFQNFERLPNYLSLKYI